MDSLHWVKCLFLQTALLGSADLVSRVLHRWRKVIACWRTLLNNNTGMVSISFSGLFSSFSVARDLTILIDTVSGFFIITRHYDKPRAPPWHAPAPNLKSTHATLISMKNLRCNLWKSPPIGQIGRGVTGQMCLSIGICRLWPYLQLSSLNFRGLDVCCILLMVWPGLTLRCLRLQVRLACFWYCAMCILKFCTSST